MSKLTIALEAEKELFEKAKDSFESGTTMDGDNITVHYDKIYSFLTASNIRILSAVQEEALEAIERMAVASITEFKAGYETAKKDAKEFIKSALQEAITNK